MDENLSLKIENIIKEAIDDAELSAKLFNSKNAREFYHILSANKDLKCSYEDFYDYFLYCKKLASFFLSNEKPYSKKAIELVKIYGEICKNDKELDKFNSLKTTNDVLMYFNSLGISRYSINDVVEFFRFRYFVLFKRLEISIARFRNAISENQRLVDESYLKCAGGIGNKERWISGVLGALSMMGSGFGGSNMASAHPFGHGGVVVDPAHEVNHSVGETFNLDYIDDYFGQSDNTSGKASEPGMLQSVTYSVFGMLSLKALRLVAKYLGVEKFIPEDMKSFSELPDQIKKIGEMGKKITNAMDKNGAINQGQKVSQLIRNSNDALYNFLATYVKGQDKPLQELVDLLICPFLTDIGEISNKKMKYYDKYGYYPDVVITPEEVRTYIGAIYGERGVGKTRFFNTAKKYIFDPAQIPAMNIAVGGFDGDKDSKTFEEFLSKQDSFVKAVSDIEYNKRFVISFDEVDKIQDPTKLLSFMEYVRNLSDKTQISYKEVGGDGKFTGRTSVIQCEAGLVFLLSNAVGPDEKGAAAWRKTSLTDDQSMLSRMFHIVFNPASDDTADSVMDTLIMEVQKNWYEANEINVEVDDTFTYNALAVLKYLGYDPNRDGVREVRNQIIPAMKTEFSRKYTRLLEKRNRLVAEGKDPRKIRFLFRWEKVDASGSGTVLRGNGKLSPIVPVLSCRYIDDVNTLGVRIFNHSSNPSAGSSMIWRPLYRADVDNFRDFMGRLESWKLWANQCRVEDMNQGVNEVAKYKIKDAYRMLRYCIISTMTSHYGRDTSARYLMRKLKKWKKAARLTVSEKNLIFDGLSEMIEQWRVRAGDSDTPAERKREEEQKKQEEIERKKREEEKKKQEEIERKKREEERKKQEEIERKKREEEKKKQEREERKRLEKEEKERKKREKEEKKKREKEEKERKKREKEEKKKQENGEKKKHKNNDVPGGKGRPNAIEEENKKEEKKMPN